MLRVTGAECRAGLTDLAGAEHHRSGFTGFPE